MALHGLKGLEPGEVMQVLDGPGPKRPRPGVSEGTAVILVEGRTRRGVPVRVLVRQLAKWEFQILAARPMTDEELAEFESWEAKR